MSGLETKVDEKITKTTILRTFKFNKLKPEEFDEYKLICKRNNETMSEDIEYFIKERIKNHSTGNSQFKIEQWFDNFDMKAVPAFFSKKDTWTNYIENTNYANYKEVERHTEAILELIKKENKKPPKFTFCYSELFGGSYDEMVNYFIPRSALEKSKKAIDKKINTI